MNATEKKTNFWNKLTNIQKILGIILTTVTIISVSLVIFGSLKRVSITIESNEYSLPLEVKNLVENMNGNEIDSILLNLLKSYHIKKVATSDLYSSVNKIMEKLKLTYIESFNNKISYAIVLKIKNNGNKEIENLEINSENIYGYYQYIDFYKNAKWGEFLNPLTIDKIKGKSTLKITIFSPSPVIHRKDIKLSTSDKVWYPKQIYDIKGFIGQFLTFEPIYKIGFSLIFIGLFIQIIIVLRSWSK